MKHANQHFLVTTYEKITPLAAVEAEKLELFNQISLLADVLRTNESTDKWLTRTRTLTELRAYKSALHAAYYAVGNMVVETPEGKKGGIILLNI